MRTKEQDPNGYVSSGKVRRGRTAYILRHLKARAQKKNLPFNLTKDDIVIPKRCPILNIPLRWNVKNRSAGPNTPSFDRLNNSKGYVKGNVVVISLLANKIKGSLEVGQLQHLLQYMKKKKPA